MLKVRFQQFVFAFKELHLEKMGKKSLKKGGGGILVLTNSVKKHSIIFVPCICSFASERTSELVDPCTYFLTN